MAGSQGFSKILNASMWLVLRSPIHRLVSSSLLLITFTGRKSGKQYTTPVSYSEHGGKLYAFTRAGWWRNLYGGAPVIVRLRGRDLAAVAESVNNKKIIASGLKEHLTKVPGDAKVYQVTLDPVTGPSQEDLYRAAQNVVMLRIQPDSLQEITNQER